MFVTHMIADHKKDSKDYEKAAKKKDPARSYATETLPTLRKHLETAQSLNAGDKTAKPTAKPPFVIKGACGRRSPTRTRNHGW